MDVCRCCCWRGRKDVCLCRSTTTRWWSTPCVRDATLSATLTISCRWSALKAHLTLIPVSHSTNTSPVSIHMNLPVIYTVVVRPSIRGRIMRCSPSVRLYVCLPRAYDFNESGRRRNFNFGGDITLDARNCLMSKSQWSTSLGTKIQKSFFAHISVDSRSIYVKLRPNWSSAHSTHVVKYSSSAKMRNCFDLSVCLSVTYYSFCLFVHHSKSESRRNFKFGLDIIWTRINWRAKTWTEGKVTGMENLKIVLCAYLCELRINLYQTNTSMIFGPFYSYRHIHCESKNCATFIFTVTLANVGRFLKFFQCRNQKETAHNKNENFPTVA